MDLVQIRYFLALARTLNFTRAAEQCNVTQPALTKSIQRLEDELGGPLLLRERSLTQLTELGRSMLPLLENTYLAAQRVKEHADSLRRRSAWPLRLGFEPDTPVEPFLPLLNAVAERLPGLELTLAEGSGSELVDDMLHGRLDAALLAGEAVLMDRLNRWALFRQQAVVVLRPGDALAELDRVPRHALEDRPVIARTRGDAPAPLAPGLPPPRHRAATFEAAMHLVRAGFGVALSTDRAARDPSLPVRPLEPAVQHDVLLTAVAGRPHAAAADSFIKLARARGWSAAQAEGSKA